MESETRKHKNFIGYEYKEIEADPPQIALCIILAVPGFLGWGAAVFPVPDGSPETDREDDAPD